MTQTIATDMVKGDVAQAMAEKLDWPESKAKKALSAILDVVGDGLNDGADVKTEIGTFKVVERAARTSRDPRTGVPIAVPAKRSVKLNFSKAVKDELDATA